MARRRIRVTDEMRSMLAGLFVNTQYRRGLNEDAHVTNYSLCCAEDKYIVALAICNGNHRAAVRLVSFAYEELGCGVTSDLRSPADNAESLDYYLAKIAMLEEL